MRPGTDSGDASGPGRAGTPILAMAAHVAPYLLWLLPLIVAECGIGIPRVAEAPIYAAKSLLCAALLLWLRPLRHYRRTGGVLDGCAFGVFAGLFVAYLWVFPESPWLYARRPEVVEAYNRWFITPLGGLPSYFSPGLFPSTPIDNPSLAYSPTECGWWLTIAKLCGSAFVIPAAEELFFRGFLYRWLRGGDFTRIPLERYDARTFWIVAVLFGLEHDRWLAGIMAGAVYGYTMIRSGRILPAIVAHSVTNLALGIYVIVSGQYGFW